MMDKNLKNKKDNNLQDKDKDMENINKQEEKEQNASVDKADLKDDKTDDKAEEQNETSKEVLSNAELNEDIRDEKFLELQARFDDLNDRYLRLFSEFDNFRKRMIKEKLELSKTASEDVIKSMLPVLDDIDRAVEANSEKNKDKSSNIEGLELIYNKFKTILRQKGVEEIKALGEEFNTDYHEAVTNVAAEKKKDKGKIVEVIQKGYMLNDKVIRYAKVVVAN